MMRQPRLQAVMRWRRPITIVAVVLAIGAGGAFGYRKLRHASVDLPVVPVRRGEFLEMVRVRGAIQAARSIQLTAPLDVPNLQIVWLAPPGSHVKAGDPVIRFDPSSAQQQLKEKLADLQQAQAALDQAVAQAQVTEQQDQLDLATARAAVEKAKLEASKQSIVSVIQGEESKVDLATAEQKLRMQQATVELHKRSDGAKIASLGRQRDKAQSEVDLTRHRLEQMTVRTPSAGIVIYLMNRSQGWINQQPFKVGDHAWPGGAIAEIPDTATLQMEGKLDEVDRGRVTVGEEIRAHVDALPEKTFTGKLAAVSALTEIDFGEGWPPTRSFKAYGKLDHPDDQLRPSMNGNLDVIVRRLPNAVSVPAKALFTHNGKPVVYVRTKDGYAPVQVQISARNPDEVAVTGLRADAAVATVEPRQDQLAPSGGGA